MMHGDHLQRAASMAKCHGCAFALCEVLLQACANTSDVERRPNLPSHDAMSYLVQAPASWSDVV